MILVGGLGTRLAPYTSAFPKPLMPLNGEPLLEILIKQLRQYGFTDITLCVGYLGHLICAYFGDGSRFGVQISYSFEDRPLGTAGPLSMVPPSCEPILVMNGDILSTLDYGDLYRYHKRERAALTAGLFTREVTIDFGVLTTDTTGRVMGYSEKPRLEYQISMGVYVLAPTAHSLIHPQTRLDVPDLVNRLLADGERVMGYTFDGHWLDIGRPADYERACEEFERLRPVFLKEMEVPSLVAG